MPPAVRKTAEQKKVDAYVDLLVAEVEFLKMNGWIPIKPMRPGGEVRWRNARMGTLSAVGQDQAIQLQKEWERA